MTADHFSTRLARVSSIASIAVVLTIAVVCTSSAQVAPGLVSRGLSQ